MTVTDVNTSELKVHCIFYRLQSAISTTRDPSFWMLYIHIDTPYSDPELVSAVHASQDIGGTLEVITYVESGIKDSV